MATLTFLGTGTSTGIPLIGCQCEVCLSDDPKDKRLRQSILIKTDNDNQILVDTTPDLRTQALREDLRELDAVIITHDHADHVHGIDDLRSFTFRREEPLPVYANEDCKADLENKFPYIFKRKEVFTKDRPVLGGGIPVVDLYAAKGNNTKIEITKGDEFYFSKMPHGYTTTLSIKHKDMLYLTDLNSIPEEDVQRWSKEKIDLLIIDCVQLKSHATHLGVNEAFDYIEKIAPKRAYLIHMNHQLSHEWLLKESKSRTSIPVQPAFDTQQLTF